MRRGELYRVRNPGGGDPRRTRVVLVVSRNALVESTYRSITCVPVFSGFHGLPTQVPVGEESGLKHDSALHCDNVVSIPRASLTDYVGSLSRARMSDVNRALTVALALDVPV